MTAVTSRTLDSQQNYPVNFIHIGLGKCGSTYLQQVWIEDEKYNMLSAPGLVQAVRDAAVSDPAKSIPLTPPQKNKKIKNVLSSEGFTWGWINQPEKQAPIRALHEVSARVLGQAHLSRQVLLLVRNPVDWLRAIHEQSIKQGGHASFARFLKDQRKVCESVLDLVYIMKCFREYADNIVVLSADELRENPPRFWKKYSAGLSVPKPSKEAISKVENAKFSSNKSLRKRVPILARLNRHSATKARYYMELADYRQVFPQEYAQMKPTAEEHWIWMNRRLVEFASDQELAEATAHLAPYEEEAFQQVFVDEPLLDWIETRFLAPLENIDTVPQDLVSRYRQSLAAALIRE